MTSLRELLRKEVVIAAGGTTYRGTLIEVTDSEVLLKSPTGFVSVQMSKVTSIRGAQEKPALQSNVFIDPSFYDMEND